MAVTKSNQKRRARDGNAWRQSNTGRLLFNAARHYEDGLIEAVKANGFPEATTTLMTLPRNLDLGGTRISELAKRCAMTKQSMSELVQQCERAGFVNVCPDPSDGRAKNVIFTAKGRKLLAAIGIAVQAQERSLEEMLGKAALRQVRVALTTFHFATVDAAQ